MSQGSGASNRETMVIPDLVEQDRERCADADASFRKCAKGEELVAGAFCSGDKTAKSYTDALWTKANSTP